MVLKVSVSISQTTFTSYIGTCGLFEKRWGCTVLRVTRCCMDTVCLSVLNSILPQSWWCFSSARGSCGEFGQGGAEMAYLCFTMFGASGGTGGGDRESGASGWWEGCWLMYCPCWASSPCGAVRSWWDIWGTNVCLLLGKAEPSRPDPGWVSLVLCCVWWKLSQTCPWSGGVTKNLAMF